MECPFCGRIAPHGATVCRGCQAEVTYGNTLKEEMEGTLECFGLGFLAAAVLGLVVWFLTSALFGVLCVLVGTVVFGAAFLWITPPKAPPEGRIRFTRNFETES